ncbi:hypothetical protein ACXWOG_09830, partial [Streptococcus pyogenes]
LVFAEATDNTVTPSQSTYTTTSEAANTITTSSTTVIEAQEAKDITPEEYLANVANFKKTGTVCFLIYDNQKKGFPIELTNVDQMSTAIISRK